MPTPTPAQQARLLALKRLAHLLDSAFEIPGGYRVGLDPIVGLIPGIGDLASPLLGIAILWQAHDLGVPKVVRLRMVFNAGIDALVGMLPFAGDLFDVAWKANTMNLALLERHAYEGRGTGAGDWMFVGLVTGLLLVLAAVPVLLTAWLIRLVVGWL